MPLSLIDTILPEFIEEERVVLISKLKSEIKRAYSSVEEVDGVLTFPDKGIELPAQEWNVNSGNYVIETKLADQEVLEDYVKKLRSEQIKKTSAEASLIEKQAEAIAAGKIVYPLNPDTVQVTIPTIPGNEV